ncbi:hypothetical protein JZ751_017026, partial [Albula glossodonta]
MEPDGTETHFDELELPVCWSLDCVSQGSAVCVYNMADILTVFNGPFAHRDGPNFQWVAYQGRIPFPRPGTCPGGAFTPNIHSTKEFPDDVVAFIRTHPAMFNPIYPMGRKPLVVRTHAEYKYTAIAVDQKLIVLPTNRSLDEDLILEELEVFKNQAPVTNIRISSKKQQLYVSSEYGVSQVSLHRCHAYGSACADCCLARDPYCAWDGLTCSHFYPLGKRYPPANPNPNPNPLASIKWLIQRDNDRRKEVRSRGNPNSPQTAETTGGTPIHPKLQRPQGEPQFTPNCRDHRVNPNSPQTAETTGGTPIHPKLQRTQGEPQFTPNCREHRGNPNSPQTAETTGGTPIHPKLQRTQGEPQFTPNCRDHRGNPNSPQTAETTGGTPIHPKLQRPQGEPQFTPNCRDHRGNPNSPQTAENTGGTPIHPKLQRTQGEPQFTPNCRDHRGNPNSPQTAENTGGTPIHPKLQRTQGEPQFTPNCRDRRGNPNSPQTQGEPQFMPNCREITFIAVKLSNRIISTDHGLLFRSVQASDQGLYYCLATENSFKRTVAKIRLRVLGQGNGRGAPPLPGGFSTAEALPQQALLQALKAFAYKPSRPPRERPSPQSAVPSSPPPPFSLSALSLSS